MMIRFSEQNRLENSYNKEENKWDQFKIITKSGQDNFKYSLIV